VCEAGRVGQAELLPGHLVWQCSPKAHPWTFMHAHSKALLKFCSKWNYWMLPITWHHLLS